jgi:hypothetical protein
VTKFMCSSIFQLCANDDTVIKVDYKVETAMRKRLAPDPDVFFFTRRDKDVCFFAGFGLVYKMDLNGISIWS